VLHRGAPEARHGLLVVVGGPQYRVGSHRQFVLMARALAQAGIPVMRFDYRGMGDSPGGARSFEQVGDDIAAAVDAFVERGGVTQVTLWGLCDGASASAFHAPRDKRIVGLVLLNPWVRTEVGEARAYLRNYYLERLLSPALWKDLVTGRLNVFASLRSFIQMIGTARGDASPGPSEQAGATAQDLPERLYRSLAAFTGRVLIVISGRDLTGQEFVDTARGADWERLLNSPQYTRRTVADADHTFSTRRWRDEVTALTRVAMTEAVEDP
ncbi:MAG: hydrolase 1, exosortase A system-associated, partial [Gammaproteobacteria bacterium]|nr:hydrolase 1, exosortase A system-associated [Gammaproteobacteria bacterium]